MAGSAKMRMAESKNSVVIILIAGTVFVSFFIIFAVPVIHGLEIGFRAKLRHTEGGAGPGEGVAHVFGADERVNVLDQILRSFVQRFSGIRIPASGYQSK